MAKQKQVVTETETETQSTPVSETVGPAPLIPKFDKANPTAFYEGRDAAVTLLLKAEKIAAADWAQIVPNGHATKPGYENSVYELTPIGIKGLSNKHRAEILKLNDVNHNHNATEFAKQAPAITAHLIQNKDVAVRILTEGVRAFQGQNAVDKTVAKPMHAALERVTIGDMDSIAGLHQPIWKELLKDQYKGNTAAQEIITAAEGARKAFDQRRDKFDQFLRVKSTLELAAQVLEGTKPFRTLGPADKKLLSVKVDGTIRNIIKKTGLNKPELTEVGREWAMEIQARSQNLKSEATVIISQSANNSRDNARFAEKAAEKATPTAAVPSI